MSQPLNTVKKFLFQALAVVVLISLIVLSFVIFWYVLVITLVLGLVFGIIGYIRHRILMKKVRDNFQTKTTPETQSHRIIEHDEL